MYVLFVYSVMCLTVSAKTFLHDYNVQRNNLIEDETIHSLGGKLELNEDEIQVNEMLMKFKEAEVDASFQNPEYFDFSRSYFSYKDDIKKSKVYQIIRRMPKGAALHIHSTLALDADYLLSLTYEDHLYACDVDTDLKLHFSDSIPSRPCQSNWTLLSELRNKTDDIIAFDANIKKHFLMYPEGDSNFDDDVNTVWKRFTKIFRYIKYLISYRPVREKHFYEFLKSFYDDSVMYVEFRSGLHSVYELNGTVHDQVYLAKLFQRVTKEFQQIYPDFVGAKLILTRRRSVNITQIREALDLARHLKEELPDIFAGFDLVGQEDLGKPLTEFLPALIEAKNEINYYFHGGETNWYGTPTDENLFDAILLGSKRIGHGYALSKHPVLLAAVAQKDIALEVNVISNQVLSLVSDVRNHPLATYLAQGLPVVLSSDDPGAWGADPLSHDFYVSFVGIASKHADLRLLKQLAINSIRYSALDDRGKTKLFRIFNRQWYIFLQEMKAEYRLQQIESRA